MFHAICGDRITLFNGNKTAKRNLSEFNHGLVFSKDPLRPNYLFEVRIEKKVSLEFLLLTFHNHR